MAIDPEGRLWVADCGHSQFAIFGPDGTFVEYWEHRGTGVGEFILQRPGSGDPFGAIAYAPDGTFYVLDVGNLRVEHFDAQRHFIKAWGGFGETAGKFREPTSIVVDATGVVSVLDDKRDVVEHYDQDGQVLGSFINSAVGGANALAIDVDGNFYVSNGAGNHIEKFSPGGKLLLTIGPEGPGTTLFAGQTGPIAVDSQGRIFVGVAHSVYIFDVNGDPLDAFTIAGLAQMAPGDGFSSGMILDGSGSGYLAELTRPTDLVEKFQLLPPFSPAVTPSP